MAVACCASFSIGRFAVELCGQLGIADIEDVLLQGFGPRLKQCAQRRGLGLDVVGDIVLTGPVPQDLKGRRALTEVGGDDCYVGVAKDQAHTLTHGVYTTPNSGVPSSAQMCVSHTCSVCATQGRIRVATRAISPPVARDKLLVSTRDVPAGRGDNRSRTTTGVMSVKIASVTSALACTSAALTVGLVSTPTAAAADMETTTFGNDAELVDNGVVQAWVVSDLRRSADVIDYPVHGTLWEATATGAAVTGTVTPVVSNFNARADDGTTYRVLFGAATPLGVNPATLAESQHTTGKLYFDVTGTAPASVVYNSLGTDRAVWVAPPPPPPATGGGRWSPPAGTQPSRADSAGVAGADAAEVAPLDAEGAGVEAGDTVPTDELPTGSQGTPLVEATPAATGGSEGTPVAEGSQGTPVEPNAAPASPAPEAPASPAPEAGAGAATPQPETTPAGSQGTPATAAPTTTLIAPPPS